jgi:hypothetical protein
LKPSGSVECHGIGCETSQALQSDLAYACTPETGTFTQISAGDTHTCGLRPNGTVACWAANPSYNGECSPP